jgi:hypothetical protein
MPTIYLEQTIMTQEEFAADQAAGMLNPLATYDDYLAMIRERIEIKREAEEAARRDGYELGAPQLELTPEDEAILDRAWAAVAAERRIAEQELMPPARAA